jgi:glyoxylase-like metal-dependent hydrolase (beta-lactamase superfamily II)
MSSENDTVMLVPNTGWDERILVCRCGDLVDTFVVVTSRYVVLIDTMINFFTAEALLAIARPVLAGRQLLVVNSHADWDHAWGNHVFATPGGLLPAPIIAQRNCAARLQSPAMKARLKSMRAEQPGRFEDVRLTPPNFLFDQKFSINGGDLTLELFATPGHKSDHIAVYIPEIRTLLAGDAAEQPFPFVESAATVPLMRKSLAEMAALEAQTAFYCHAPVNSGATLLNENIAYFDKIEARCQAALARGVKLPIDDAADIETLVGFPFEEAISSIQDSAGIADFYRTGHRFALQTMLEYLNSLES